ncbi:MAG TPA: hypothetical protein VLI41_10750 [Phenylobacterium sp.]|uniref:hypothetical protein n=1 Tax=Phenylobacterium sp. TaxID=1871053 RepID=UPI002BEEA814|nr:hypothetical protein [Phenylobacterium sp.]HSV03670.1 hypothetical protein [Phenylobacterium sp.]
MQRLAVFAAAAMLLAACSPQKPAAPKPSGIQLSPLAKLNTDLPMDEFMGHVVDPQSFIYWGGSGTVETAKGMQDLSPTTDEGWEKLESAAATLIEAGNMLQLPGRARHLPDRPDSDWYQHAQKLSALAVVAKMAAEKHDKAGVYKSGADLYGECTSCHEEYVIQPQIKANGPAPGNPLPDWPADVKARQQAYAAKAK